MLLFNQGQLKDSVKVNLHVQNYSRLAFGKRNIFLKQMPMVKDYVLRAADSVGYKFVLDEAYD